MQHVAQEKERGIGAAHLFEAMFTTYASRLQLLFTSQSMQLNRANCSSAE